jgi:hypothetical protein
MKRGKNIQIYVTTKTYDAWSKNLTAKELSMFSYPADAEELSKYDDSRVGMTRLLINMPAWWHEWYKSLSREDKFRFARAVEKRLKDHNLL